VIFGDFGHIDLVGVVFAIHETLFRCILCALRIAEAFPASLQQGNHLLAVPSSCAFYL